jgi:purine catabolism regulator
MIEVFRLLVIVVYQNKREKLRKQNAFLLNFVSNTFNDNVGHLEDYAKEFQWNIQFPLMILLLSNGAKDLINNSRIIEYCRSVILSKWGKSNDEIRFASIDDQILFLVNVESQHIDHQNILYLFESTDKAHPSSVIKIAYSNPIFELKDISKTYNLMNQSMAHMKRSESKKRIFNEDDLKIYDMLKTIQNEDIESFIQSLFSALNHITQIDKETLLYTYYVYIESRFNINTTAKKLFVHYNTVRYRLEQLKSYSIIPNINEDYFKTYFALYLYFSVYPSKTSFFLKQ